MNYPIFQCRGLQFPQVNVLNLAPQYVGINFSPMLDGLSGDPLTWACVDCHINPFF